MKKKTGLFLCLLLVFFCAAALADVKITESAFPDQHFREYVEQKCDRNGDGVLSDAEIRVVTVIEVDGKGIASMKGVEYFSALERLNCGDNKLKSLDVSKNQKLKILNTYKNQHVTIDLSKNTALESLNLARNMLVSVNLSGCRALNSLDIKNNSKLKVLNIGGCPKLVSLIKSGEAKDSVFGYGWFKSGLSSWLFIDKGVKLETSGAAKAPSVVKVQAITLNKTEVSLKKGKTVTLKVKKISPADATETDVKWTSSNKKVATVDQNGKVKGKGKGTCTITCAAQDGSGVKVTCKVIVK